VKLFCGLCVDLFVPRKKRKEKTRKSAKKKTKQTTINNEQKTKNTYVIIALWQPLFRGGLGTQNDKN